ncbi:hypothetical protein GSI_11380 [Ganoderma sinense ZZ0214-1]|uniref:Integrase catalytic domain-containing protein n=1 Tax=Ganoderma sinense ZZ0214-1 TaxID=1077348 RepID=A0A2G8RVU4_9APHY|nr:hypothetical protein GSI_11380 [Ganoderma sinense ZZ0214-1]
MYRTRDVAELVFSEVYKLHGLPKAIVSDHDVLFTSTFWSELHGLIGTKLRLSSAYHPELDGSTERANRTVSQMLRQCIRPDQKDWVARLPAIEFAINMARSDATGFAPFFLNTGRMPRPIIWDRPTKDEYPGVRVYAQKVKSAVMAAHDSVIAARVKHVRDANRRRRPAPFVEGDLVYISTKNISIPKGLARKLVPKYMGPYCIVRDFRNSSYRIKLPSGLKRRGVHDVFHASLLRIHEPNDDRLFPGRLDSQVFELADPENEWAVKSIIGHAGSGEKAVFEAEWKSGDRSWIPHATAEPLNVFKAYLEALGVDSIASLPEGTRQPPDDPQLFSGCIDLFARTITGRSMLLLILIHFPKITALLTLLLARVHAAITAVTLVRTPPFRPVMPPIHIHGTLLPSGSFLISSIFRPETLSYDAHMLRSYLDFNDLLRTLKDEDKDKPFPVSTQPIPGRYCEFQALFDEDERCQYGFALVDPVTGLITRGSRPPPPRKHLIPSLLEDTPTDAADPYKFSRDERVLFNQLQTDAAERESHRLRVSNISELGNQWTVLTNAGGIWRLPTSTRRRHESRQGSATSRLRSGKP